MSIPTPQNFSIVPPQERICDPKTGIISRSWWRYFQQIFALLGGYQAGTSGNPTLSAVAAVAYSEFGRSGPDYGREIGDLDIGLQSLPNSSGRIAQLEARVARLEILVAFLAGPKLDLIPLQREADMTRAFTMGVHD